MRALRAGFPFPPGFPYDTFRVNRRATLTTDGSLLAPCEVDGRLPKLGILVDIDEAYTQCSKAFIRSDCWNPERFVGRTMLAISGQMLREVQGEDFDAERYDAERAVRYGKRQGFY